MKSHETEKIYKQWLKPENTSYKLVNLKKFKKEKFEAIEKHHWQYEHTYDQDYFYDDEYAKERKEKALYEWNTFFKNYKDFE